MGGKEIEKGATDFLYVTSSQREGLPTTEEVRSRFVLGDRS